MLSYHSEDIDLDVQLHRDPALTGHNYEAFFFKQDGHPFVNLPNLHSTNTTNRVTLYNSGYQDSKVLQIFSSKFCCLNTIFLPSASG